ncbi:TPA: FAD-dependent 5-carboxymethylaminomethyl-2-thiouridine(34) oxidoreductase MnmC [Neisseria weaveri]
MTYLAWNGIPPLTDLVKTYRQHPTPQYWIICLQNDTFPTWRPSENPNATETLLHQNLIKQQQCLQFNSANVFENILPGVYLWILPPAHAGRIHEYFPTAPVWQNEPVAQSLPEPQKPWFDIPRSRQPEHVLIIGAGIAGASTAYELAKHGVSVTVIESGKPAQAASGNHQGLLYAKISPHDTEQTELLLSGYGYTRRLLQHILPDQNGWGGNGILHLDYSEEESLRNHTLGQQTRHRHLYRHLSAHEAGEISGIPLRHSALYWPQGVWLNPERLIQALLDHPLIKVSTHNPLVSCGHDGKNWLAHTAKHTIRGSHIVYCTGAQSKQMPDPNVSLLPFRQIRGQTDLLPENSFSRQLKCAISANGYISPAWRGYHCFGATFVQHSQDTTWQPSDLQTNIDQLNMLNTAFTDNPQLFSDGLSHIGHAALRCDSADHLPIVGPLADISEMQQTYAKLALDKNYRLTTPCPYLPDAYINTAHGTRGLTTAPICSAMIAAHILGLPQPLSQRIRTAIHPNRIIIRAIARQKPLLQK